MSFWCLRIDQKINIFLRISKKRLNQIKKRQFIFFSLLKNYLIRDFFWYDVFLEARAEILKKFFAFWSTWRLLNWKKIIIFTYSFIFIFSEKIDFWTGLRKLCINKDICHSQQKLSSMYQSIDMSTFAIQKWLKTFWRSRTLLFLAEFFNWQYSLMRKKTEKSMSWPFYNPLWSFFGQLH